MSYSFGLVASSKSEARTKFAEEFDKVVAQQPVHAKDRDAATANANAIIDILEELQEGQALSLRAWGSVGWRAEGVFTSASIGAEASVFRKAEQ